MNPVKWVIFLISLLVVSIVWFKAFERNLKSPLTLIFATTNLILFIMLSYALPYATWWLMHIWRW